MSNTPKRCGTCRLLRDYDTGARPTAEALATDGIFRCGWGPAALPWAWRYARREVLGVDVNDGTVCATWEDAS